jgi:hypothetical protein
MVLTELSLALIVLTLSLLPCCCIHCVYQSHNFYYHYSLYTPRVNEIAPKQYVYDSNAVIGRHTAAPSGISYMPYLHETPCSWGAVYYPEVLQHTFTMLHAVHVMQTTCVRAAH